MPLFDPEGFNSGAERAIFWTRGQLEDPQQNAKENARRWDFLGELPRNRKEDIVTCSSTVRHGIPSMNTFFQKTSTTNEKWKKLFSFFERNCFQGHTHVPGVFTEGLRFFSPDDLGNEYTVGEEKIMVNVGSVGQPRDGDPRSCYVILTEEGLQYRRIEYDFEKTIKKIYDIPELDNFLGDRLRAGR